MARKGTLKTILVTLFIILLHMECFAATSKEYANYELGNELTQIPVMFIDSYKKYPKEVDHKYIGWLSPDGYVNYSEQWEGGNYYYHYINMIDVINLYRDGAYREIAPKQHKFFFAGNTVIFNENSNTVNINGESQYVGKIRYADTKDDKYRKGGFFGSKVTYDKSAVTIGTWIPAEALDEVLQFGVQFAGNEELKSSWGIYVPGEQKRLIYKGETYPSLIYSQMKNKLPENIKSKIKEPMWNTKFTLDVLKVRNLNGGKPPRTETIEEMQEHSRRKEIAHENLNSAIASTNNLLFGEDFSNVDNFDQVAKVVKALFDFYPESTSYKEYRELSEKELAEKFREMAKNPPIVNNYGKYAFTVRKLDFYDTLYKTKYISYSKLKLTVYLSGKEKQNGIAFSIKPIRFDDDSRTIVYYMLKEIYPHELAETIINESMFANTLNPEYLDAPVNKGTEKFNVVRATGNHKYFYGVLPEDKIYTHAGFLYFLIDNHPALPNEFFCTPFYDLGATSNEKGSQYLWGRGFREDFFTFSPLSQEVRKELGMPELWDMIDYKNLIVTPGVRAQEGSSMEPLEKCTNNPYDSYKKLFD